MGTDIHEHVEIKVGDRWVCLSTLVYEDLYERGNLYQEWYAVGVPKLQRNYNVFRVLAGVRAYYDMPTPPIDWDRGFPLDASDEVKIFASEIDGFDYHSASWLTLAELVSYAWYQPITITSRERPSFLRYLRRYGKPVPDTWYPRQRYLRHFRKWFEAMDADTLIQVTYQQSFMEFCGEILDLLGFLLRMGIAHDRVRLVFCFDN